MLTKEESVVSALGNFIEGHVDNEHDKLYNNSTESGRFYLIYDSDSKPYIIVMKDGVMIVLDISTWKSVIEVEKEGSTYSFPVMRVNVPKSILIDAYKELTGSVD